MVKFILKRLLLSIITIILVSIIVFSIIHILPGDPIDIMFGKNPDKDFMEDIRHQYSFDKPIAVQYFLWMSKVVRLDFGESIIYREPVINLISERIWRTVFLAISSLLLSLLFAIPIGLISAYKQHTKTDLVISSITFIIISIPEFWSGLILIMIFGVYLQILPASGYVPPSESLLGFFKSIIMPIVSLSLIEGAQFTRMIRTKTIDTLSQDYAMLARANGISEKRILAVHCFRNALIPVLTTVGMTFAYTLGGEIVIEKVFNYPGLALLLFSSIGYRDYPTVQAIILIFSIFFILVSLIIDILYSFINPRISVS